MWYYGCDWDAFLGGAIENDLLRSAAQKGLYPLGCEHVPFVGLEFIYWLNVVYLTKCLSEVKGDDVCLVTYVHVCEKSVR